MLATVPVQSSNLTKTGREWQSFSDFARQVVNKFVMMLNEMVLGDSRSIRIAD